MSSFEIHVPLHVDRSACRDEDIAIRMPGAALVAGGGMREDFEKERLAALAARRAAEFEGPDHRSLETRYGPGSFGCHEALHVTNLVVELLERELVGHSAVLLDAFWYGKVREAQALLYSAYSQVGQDHLATPLPEDESSGRGGSH